MHLSVRFNLLITFAIILALLVYIPWSQQSQQHAAENKALSEARVLTTEMHAIWDYINANQNKINYNSDGSFDFKGVYCTIAGKAIVSNFTKEVDFGIRFVRENPRNKADVPDDFERDALKQFNLDRDTEYYEIVGTGDNSVLRYVTSLSIDANCLDCHGDPVGTKDPSGYLREGMQIGELAGAVSIEIPMTRYRQEIDLGIRTDVFFVIILLTILLLLVNVAMHFWVIHPIRKLELATNDMAKGNYRLDLEDISAKGEIKDLKDDYLAMAKQLKSVHETLETKVALRTEEIKEANDALLSQHERIERMNEDLQQMNQKLHKENEFKSNFLAIMSHELRTPLSAIIAFTDLWDKDTRKKGTDECEYVEEIKNNSRVLLSMIDNIIDVARIEADRFDVHFEEVDLVDVVNAVESTAKPLAAQRSINLTTSVDAEVPLIISDGEALRKIIANLVNNAIKFTPEGGYVHVDVVYDDDAKEVNIIVRDTGIGIDEKDEDVIFERFVQADSSISREFGGSGLGLALVKDLSELLSGNVSVKSRKGIGSEFRVRLPLRGERNGNADSSS